MYPSWNTPEYRAQQRAEELRAEEEHQALRAARRREEERALEQAQLDAYWQEQEMIAAQRADYEAAMLADYNAAMEAMRPGYEKAQAEAKAKSN